MLRSLDTETTGVDWGHGARPFFVTTCDEKGAVTYWEWDVDPITRAVRADPDDLEEIKRLVSNPGGRDSFVLQNGKFDATAMSSLDPWFADHWPWDYAEDTLLAGHLLASNRPHNLTDMALQYLGVSILPHEERLEAAVKKCRSMVQQARLRRTRSGTREPLADWDIAGEDNPRTPGAKGGEDGRAWKFDTFLPRAMVAHYGGAARLSEAVGFDVSHWETVLASYANCDSEVTLGLWLKTRRVLEERGLTAIYRERTRLLPATFALERKGVTVSASRQQALTSSFKKSSREAGEVCVALAKDYGYELNLPKNSVNGSLRTFCFDVLKLPHVRNPKAKTDAPTLDAKTAIPHYLATLPRDSDQVLFLTKLVNKRAWDTALSYMEAYAKFRLPLDPGNPDGDTFVLHPSLNVTGTDTLRMGCSNPNAQQVGKKEHVNLRKVFGPAPGREWWSLDAKNIELRIPAYESGEKDFIDLFERPNDPPYFGSNHLLISHVLFPDEFEACIREGIQTSADEGFKRRYKDTLYQRVKNGNFAVQYGAVDRADGTGTADRTYGIPGAQKRIQSRFSKQDGLNRKWVAFANTHGYVETMPDKSVDPTRGYPLLCTRTAWGKVLPTVPLNYHVQGTAMWWMCRAMVRCHALLGRWRREGFDAHMVLQVHDELVFDLPAHPKGILPQRVLTKGILGGPTGKGIISANVPRVLELKREMERGGDDIGVPTPVGVDFHPNTWAEGVSL